MGRAGGVCGVVVWEAVLLVSDAASDSGAGDRVKWWTRPALPGSLLFLSGLCLGLRDSSLAHS